MNIKKIISGMLLAGCVFTQNIMAAEPHTSIVRDHLGNDTVYYLRLPSTLDTILGTTEVERFVKLSKDRTYKTIVADIKAQLKDQEALKKNLIALGMTDMADQASYAIALLSRVLAPTEVVAVGNNPLSMLPYMTTVLDFKNVAEFNNYLDSMQVPFKNRFDQQGWLEKDGFIMHFDAKTKRVYGTIVQRSEEAKSRLMEWIDVVNSKPNDKKLKPITLLENQIDPSGEGAFLWMALDNGTRNMLKYSPDLRTPFAQHVLLNPNIKAYGFGMGRTANKQGQISVAAEVNFESVTGYRLPEKYDLNFKTIDNPSILFNWSIPSDENLKGIENKIIEQYGIEVVENYHDGIEEIAGIIGFDPNLFIRAFGPELAIYTDNGGNGFVVKIRDQKAYKEIKEIFNAKSLVNRKLRSNITHYTFSNIFKTQILENITRNEDRNQIGLLSFISPKVAPLPLFNMMILDKINVYMKEEGDWLFVNTLPQPLLERKSAKTNVSDWLKTQGYKANEALVGATFEASGAYQRYYYNQLSLLQNFSDDLGLKIEFEKLPLYSELKTDEKSHIGIQFSATPDTVGITYQYDLTPFDFGYYGLYANQVVTLGLVSAFALPAYSDYVKRTYIAEGIHLASGLKSAMTEYYFVNNKWPKSNAEVGMDDDISAGHVTSISITGEGEITIKYDGRVDYGQLILRGTPPSQDNRRSFQWTCKSGTYAINRYIPSSCSKL